jgi:hypothetical protein
VLVGLVVAAIGLAMARTMNARTIAEFALTMGAGWLGAAMAAPQRIKADRSRPPASPSV